MSNKRPSVALATAFAVATGLMVISPAMAQSAAEPSKPAASADTKGAKTTRGEDPVPKAKGASKGSMSKGRATKKKR